MEDGNELKEHEIFNEYFSFYFKGMLNQAKDNSQYRGEDRSFRSKNKKEHYYDDELLKR